MGNNKMTREQKIAKLKELIAIELDNCKDLDWPYVCHMKNNPEGKRAIEEMVVEQCMVSGITVGQALDRVERAYNANRMED
jgi:hypothetical protein